LEENFIIFDGFLWGLSIIGAEFLQKGNKGFIDGNEYFGAGFR